MNSSDKHQQLAAVVTKAIGDEETYHYQLITHSQSFIEIKPNSNEIREKNFEQLIQVVSINAHLADPSIHKKILNSNHYIFSNYIYLGWHRCPTQNKIRRPLILLSNETNLYMRTIRSILLLYR